MLRPISPKPSSEPGTGRSPSSTGNFQTYALADGLCLDARRALWHAPTRALVVADLHLGYAWAQRKAGLLLPVSCADDTTERLQALQRCYHPKQILFLGDIVHRVVELPALEAELSRLLECLGGHAQLRFLTGNHDRALARLLTKLGLATAQLEQHARLGPHVLLHGDVPVSANECDQLKAGVTTGLTIMGHEHPALRLGDGVTGCAKCPCFLIGPRVLVLPAFSLWAAGAAYRPGAFMSDLAKREHFTQAVAILNDKLLPIPLQFEA